MALPYDHKGHPHSTSIIISLKYLGIVGNQKPDDPPTADGPHLDGPIPAKPLKNQADSES
jgi:hypothetical protein